MVFESDLNLKATELRLGLPGTEEKEDKNLHTHVVIRNNKRQVRETSQDSVSISKASHHQQHVETVSAPPPKYVNQITFQESCSCSFFFITLNLPFLLIFL